MLHITCWLKTTQRFKDSFALLSDQSLSKIIFFVFAGYHVQYVIRIRRQALTNKYHIPSKTVFCLHNQKIHQIDGNQTKKMATLLFFFFFLLFFLQDNLVGSVVIISLLIWIPASCLISWIDRQRAERDQKEWEWRRQDELIHPEDKRRIIHIRVPRRTVSMAASNCNQKK